MLLLLLACADAPKPPTPVCDGDPASVELGATPTWSDDVAPLVAERCASCHTAGGIGPFPLDSYAAAAPMASAMAFATASRSMPPWLPASCGDCQTFHEAPVLSDVDIAVFDRWAADGAPEGDPGVPFPDVILPESLSDVDVVLDAGAAFTAVASGSDDVYRCFILDSPTATDAFLTGFEVQVDNAAILHHVVLYNPVAEDAALDALDAADPGLGWECYGSAGVEAEVLFAWAPGGGATAFPEGTGLPLRGGGRVVAQMHYNVVNGPGDDRSGIALSVASEVPKPARMLWLSKSGFSLPPGQASVTESLTTEVSRDATAWGVLPHMHEVGATFRLEADRGGERECLVDVPEWDFHWQGFFFYEEPVALKAGDAVDMTCTWDTRSRTEATPFGEGTEEEMCMAFVYLTLD